LSFNLFRVVVSRLVSLREGVVISNARSVVTEAAKIGFGALLLFDSNRHNFDLVVGQSNLDFKLCGHLELVGFNRVVVVLLLLSNLVALLSHHLLLLKSLSSR